MDHSDNECRSIIISDMPRGISADKLTIHFQKKKFGGGDVINVNIFKSNETDKQTAIVIFEDPKDAANVLKYKHVFNNVQVTVKPYSNQIFSETTIIIQNKILQQFAANKPQKFDACLIYLANKYNLSFTTKKGPDEWLVVGHWIQLNFLKSEIIETLKKPIMDSQVDNLLNMDFTDNTDDLLTVSKSNWNFLEKNHTLLLLKIFRNSLLHSQKDDSNTLQLNTLDGVAVLKQELKKFISLNCEKLTKNSEVSTDIKYNSQFSPLYNTSQADGSSFKTNAFQDLDKEKGKFANYIYKTYDFSEGIKINICHGDITREIVDAIVNASNNKLYHSGGVAKAISDASKDGGSVQNWCHKYVEVYGEVPVSNIVISHAGALDCQKIFHAIGPEWFRYGQSSTKLLENTFFNCLKAADAENFSSIALPLVSSGIFGVPKEVAATCLVIAVAEFSSQPVQSLKNIRFIDPDIATVVIVQKTFDQFKSTGSSKESFRKLITKENSKGLFSNITNMLFSNKNASGQNKAESEKLQERKSENNFSFVGGINQNYDTSQMLPFSNISKTEYDISHTQNKPVYTRRLQENSTEITGTINYNNSAIKMFTTNNKAISVMNANHEEIIDDEDSLVQVEPGISIPNNQSYKQIVFKIENKNNLKPIDQTNLELKAQLNLD